MISAAEPEKQFIEVLGKRMAYAEMGKVIRSCFSTAIRPLPIWRNIMPHLVDQGRCIAVDLIGMGDSDKLDNPGADSYRYVDHRDYLFAAWEALGIEDQGDFRHP